jgi:hypothetical protein
MGSFEAAFSPASVVDLSTFSVRDGRLAPVTCVACGCRLERHDGSDAWWHFAGVEGRDARGCIVGCATAPHYDGGAHIGSEAASNR